MSSRLTVGLPNFGNTCYINSMLQCLRYQKPLVFMLREHKTDPYATDPTDQLLAAFIELLYADADVKELHLFVRNLAQTQEQFRLLRQCDSHELYLYLVDTFFEKHAKLTNPFRGELQSVVSCQVCHAESITCHPFISLSLEMHVSNAPLLVSDMLHHFSKTERLQDPVDCASCNARQQSTKTLSVKTMPKLLVLHLKRFHGMRKNASSIEIEKILEVNHRKYKLCALCNHSGSLSGGHYTATCLRKDDLWVVCNDSTVSKIQHLPPKTNVPYVLFYEAI